MKGKVQNIHMVGIGGSGMSGIAEVLVNLGYRVSGSDIKQNGAVARMQDIGVRVCLGHAAANLDQADVLVKSTAVADQNPEVMEARNQGIPVIPRAEMLAELMRLKTGIAVAGTHGKTTTTSLLGSVFIDAGFDPTVIIGGRLNSLGSNAQLGQGEFLIAEADESDGSFLCLLPIMTIVTNVDRDHLDFYPDLKTIEDSFVRFLNQIPFYGTNVVCGDDPGVQRILPRVKRPLLTYGFAEGNAVRGEITDSGTVSRFRVLIQGRAWGEIVLSQPGEHNVLNALGVIGLSLQAGIPKQAIIRGLERFIGVGRRMEKKGQVGNIPVIDDYGHHPTEIRATLETMKKVYPDKRLVVVFQPHRFSRTKALFGEFCRAFDAADLLILTEIYPASEDPIPGINGNSLLQGIRQVGGGQAVFCPDFDQCLRALQEQVSAGDVVLTLGAGSVWQLGESFLLSANRD
ncbi:MAG: UDP-N-acetylmuramate--L-alanine ligase [Desulfohalobiaceae bacterium]|nr:UDP-N-acetylmuramate--L-alanine ligase [Desulfohalobiaceae bacterium]